jgi:hypothetical protein
MRQEDKFLLLTIDELRQWLEASSLKRSVKLIQNHHTYIPDYAEFNGNNHFRLLEAMEKSHVARKFDEIAQHFTTFPDGMIAVCRSLEKDPAGIKGANQGGVCIENLGDFDTDRDSMTDKQRNVIVQLNAFLCHKFKLSPNTDTIVYHHWFDRKTGERTNGTGFTKTCPGTEFFGGNTVEAARTCFIPLIVQTLQDLVQRGTQHRQAAAQ